MNIKDEVLFWTGIMKDHANFQLQALSPKEVTYIEKSTYFMNFFAKLQEEIKEKENIKPMYSKLVHGLMCFIDYKRTILKNLLTCSIAINMPPTNISHQINEANEFMLVLSTPAPKHVDEQMRTAMLTERLKVWISDVMGHAAFMAAQLEPIEAKYIMQSEAFKSKFEKLAIKSSELQMMLMYTGLQDGHLKQLADEVVMELNEFICFCDKIKELRAQCKIMANGTFTPLVPDHFNREHRHWIEKIKEYVK